MSANPVILRSLKVMGAVAASFLSDGESTGCLRFRNDMLIALNAPLLLKVEIYNGHVKAVQYLQHSLFRKDL